MEKTLVNEYALADVIIDRPQEFMVGGRAFRLYPVTLAKMLLLKRQLDGLGLDIDIIKCNPYLECMRMAQAKRQACCTILAYHTTPNTRGDLFDADSIRERRDFFDKSLSEEDLASMLIVVLDDKTDSILAYLGLDKEHERMQQVIKVKARHDKSSVSFCGVSLFGTFIAPLMKMGYTEDEILYGRGYAHLRVRLADEVTQLMLTDDERKELPEDLGGALVDASDPKNADEVMSMLKKGDGTAI